MPDEFHDDLMDMDEDLEEELDPVTGLPKIPKGDDEMGDDADDDEEDDDLAE